MIAVSDEYETARKRLVDGLASRGAVEDERVLDALAAVPRHEFVPQNRRDAAYADRPLPIGDGQTISAPHMVGIMAEVLELEAGERVLEIGTGCGYHAAVTAELVGPECVYTVEVSETLASEARQRLDRLGYGDISVRVGDGREGWVEHAPYDAAYLTCGASSFPEALRTQVRTGGQLLGPIGVGEQTLVLGRVTDRGDLERSRHGSVRFVDMRADD